MSQSGYLTFYGVDRRGEPADLVRSLVTACRPTSINLISRTLGADREWDDFRAGGDAVPSELLDPPADPAALAGCYREGVSLTAWLLGTPLLGRIGSAVRGAIPEAIRGRFVPDNSLWLRVGGHDLFDTAEHDDGLFIARPFVSVAFMGYSTPDHWAEFRRLVFRVPEIQAIRRELEVAAGGPLEQCVIWSV